MAFGVEVTLDVKMEPAFVNPDIRVIRIMNADLLRTLNSYFYQVRILAWY